jgi:hypothetical protein
MARWANEDKYAVEVNAAHYNFPNVPSAIIKGIIGAESAFRADARRGEAHLDDASHGLMQILLSTAQGLGFAGPIDSLYAPAVNLYYGTKLLSGLYARLGNWPDAISAYNGGVRPELGFGGKATRQVTVCLARDSNGKCIKSVTVQPGHYANEEYVNKVLANAQYFTDKDVASSPVAIKPSVTIPKPSAPTSAGGLPVDPRLAAAGGGTLLLVLSALAAYLILK